ncbi:pVIII [Skunk adenovirus 1]|uniref:Pre-hexon-linking protein VIII n=1 Tax=Skunk adenovirus 1 TaxID=2698728 RepID=A0A0K0MGI3_9ADEN|nr:pVIII [Skunk adenovirus PB1]QDF59491.1 pVIII [African pygmy hedgehog adenovirus 1]QKF54478.1 pVIII [Skunk adenovirus HUN/2009]UKT59826.1 pVIII [Raccoon adenovirus]UKT59856.1 pVIII [Porcupine adenovirus]UWY10657.1 pVIII [Skunk adenovirus 1]
MSKEIPTPYMWSFQPQLGNAAGAAQDYSTQMNWFSAGPSMINQVYKIRDLRNRILMTQAEITETPRSIMNPPIWPASMVAQPEPTPETVALPRNYSLENSMTNSGMQLAGGARLCPDPPYCFPINGRGITLSEDIPSVSWLRPDGVFQLGGGGRSSFNPTQAYLTLQQGSSVPRSGGIGAVQFVQEFVPQVYFNPFSGPPDTFPDQFIPNYDIVTNSVDGYD